MANVNRENLRWHLAFLIAAVILALLAGCSGSDLRRVTIPAFQPTINTATEARLREGVPRDLASGVPTLPETSTRFTGDLQRPALEVQRVTVDRSGPGLGGFVSLLFERGRARTLIRNEYALPAPGEILDLIPARMDFADQTLGAARPVSFQGAEPETIVVRDTIPAPDVEAQIRGSPQDIETDAQVPDERPGWFSRLWTNVRNFLAFIGAVAIAVLGVRLWGRFSLRLSGL